MKTILADLKKLKKGVGQIVAKFAGNTPGYNWKTKHGKLPKNTNAVTLTKYDKSTGTVTTIFDTDKFGNASDLSIARTILHEAVHAYVLAVTYNSSSVSMRKQLLGPNWVRAFINSGHSFMATNYINQISDALKNYGQNKGYSLNSQFYIDLAWGGLTHYDPNNNNKYVETPWFKNAVSSISDRKRIVNVINNEQNGKNQQKGKKAGC